MTTMLNPRTHGPDHPASYYVDTARYDQRYPQLTESIQADVCVVGGGFSGVNTALELAERGYNVVLLEAHRIGWGASGRNGGQLVRGIGHGLAPFRKALGDSGMAEVEAMGSEALAIVAQRIERYGIDCDLRWGYADVANRPRHWRELQADVEALKKTSLGDQFELVPPERLGEVVGSDRYLGGVVDHGSGHLHPLNLVTGEARAAADLGVRIFERSAVTEMVEGEPVRIKTELGEVTAQRLVLCGNAYVAGLNKTLAGKVLPAGSYVMATEPLDDATAKRVLPGNHAVCDMNVALDYYRLSADNRLLFGGLCNYSGRDPHSIEAVLKPHLERVFPYLKDVRIDYQWGGMIGIGANRFPQVGRLQPNIYYAQAYSGHGVNVTHLAARVIAESIHAESGRLDLLEKVKHITFPGGPRFRSPLLALGMLYHRLKDVL
ncbi:FAD-dependent oxidoreductase [Saccharospirillum sp. MSK14-1]|uniref:NAD(P)/FAD-dependent oxidoreductase n=1 Tax=Saccharospirillum sp. MSK14-1 TaxID=1897632 RepID=UPI000D4B293F|nr:FAD-binding oxidoreductase [Saccharospirillum sp. MSK14-1]PTY38406.1 FAD-dependent oxidoreductase [Saccharospirillum sp. MSK14-1]